MKSQLLVMVCVFVGGSLAQAQNVRPNDKTIDGGYYHEQYQLQKTATSSAPSQTPNPSANDKTETTGYYKEPVPSRNDHASSNAANTNDEAAFHMEQHENASKASSSAGGDGSTLESADVQLDLKSVNALKAIMAVPQEAALFYEKTDLKSVTVVKQSASETIYVFEGKRRGMGNGGFRQLQILETRTVKPALTVTYSARLIP